MNAKKMFAAANCLALLLFTGARAEASHGVESFFGAAPRVLVPQRRAARRGRKRRMSERTNKASVTEGVWGGKTESEREELLYGPRPVRVR